VTLQLRTVGRSAVLAEVEDTRAALALAAWARRQPAEKVGAVEIVPAARTVLFDGVADTARLGDLLRTWSPAEEAPLGELVEVSVVYDGPDLEFVASRWGTGVDEVVARHTAIEFVAAFCGFAPGFSYLSGLAEELAVPRLDTPRTRVPEGAVALAGSWCGVYPSASPGGWRLLGRTDAALWDPEREPPALLAPGTRVRFRAVG
jgi:KipI family sensor histidine kinase inhibitor